MKIAIDLDGVIVNTPFAMIEYINERLPIHLEINDIKTYCIENALPKPFQWIVENGFRDVLFWKKVTMIPQAAEAIERLYHDGHYIWFATSSLPENLRKKINHLSRNLPFLPKDFVWRHTINLQDKSLLDVDILIDDCLGHLLHPNRKYVSVVLDYPWNQTNGSVPNLIRAYNWQDIYNSIRIIESLMKENAYDNV